MKRSNLLALAGGLLAAVAFFLPLFVVTPSGIFGSGDSLLVAVQQVAQAQSGLRSNFFYMVAEITFLFEPAAAVLLIISSLLALRAGGKVLILGVVGAVLGLTLVLWVALFLYARSFSTRAGGWGDLLQLLGSGWWLAAIGCALGLVGALLGCLGQSTPGGALVQRVLRPNLGALLLLAGGLVLIIGFFFTAFYPGLLGKSLFDLLRLPAYPYVLWPDLLAMLLLLGCGLLALTGRRGAYLGGLIGALVGAAFLFLFTGFILSITTVLQELRPDPGYWLTAIGCVLGLIGALVGLLGRSTSAPAAPQEAWTPELA